MEEIDKLALLSKTLFNERIIEQRKDIERLKKQLEIEHERLIKCITDTIEEKCFNYDNEGFGRRLEVIIVKQMGEYLIEVMDKSSVYMGPISLEEIDEIKESLKINGYEIKDSKYKDWMEIERDSFRVSWDDEMF